MCLYNASCNDTHVSKHAPGQAASDVSSPHPTAIVWRPVPSFAHLELLGVAPSPSYTTDVTGDSYWGWDSTSQIMIEEWEHDAVNPN